MEYDPLIPIDRASVQGFPWLLGCDQQGWLP